MAPSAAERRARHIVEMRLALAENLSLEEARTRLAKQRWAEADSLRQQRNARCGTEDQGEPEGPQRPEYWWEKY